MFNTSFLKLALREFALHPAALLKLAHGFENADAYLADQRLKKWRKKPVDHKKIGQYTIKLEKSDISGLSPHIGSDGVYEPAQTCLMQNVLKPGAVFVDVGANIGWYTLLAASRGCRVYAFEPEPNNYKLLMQSLELNGFRNAHVYGECLSNVNGTAKLFLHGENLGAHSITRECSCKSIAVPCRRLDDLGLGKVDVLKVDVEGAEALVLEGAQNTVAGGR